MTRETLPRTKRRWPIRGNGSSMRAPRFYSAFPSLFNKGRTSPGQIRRERHEPLKVGLRMAWVSGVGARATGSSRIIFVSSFPFFFPRPFPLLRKNSRCASSPPPGESGGEKGVEEHKRIIDHGPRQKDYTRLSADRLPRVKACQSLYTPDKPRNFVSDNRQCGN